MYLPFVSSEQVVADLEALGGSEAYWLLCIAHRHRGELPDLLVALRRKSIRACGGIFPGLIVGAQTNDEGIVAIRLPEGSREYLAHLGAKAITWQAPLLPLTSDGPASATILVDSQAPNISGLLENIYDHYGGRISHIGAGTGFPDLRQAPSIFTAEGLQDSAALLLIIPRSATVQVRHGWRRVAGPFVASRTSNNRIQELNWEPAGDVYHREIARLSSTPGEKADSSGYFAAHPLCIAREDGEDVMRDPLHITAANELVVLSDVTENAVMYLAEGDGDSLAEAARFAVDDCGNPRDVERCLVIECFSRALLLGTDFARELGLVADRVACFTDTPMEGVLGLGEIASNGQRCLEFHNKTFAIAVVHRLSS